MLYDKVPTVIMTSATLSVGGTDGFRHFQERLGPATAAETLQLGSPFDYREQVELHLFRAMPDPSRRPGGATRRPSLEKIPEYVERTQGPGVRAVHQLPDRCRRPPTRLRPWCAEQGYPLLSQGDGLPRTQMVEQFRDGGQRGAVRRR